VLQFCIFCANFIKNHTDIDRYWQKNEFLLLAKFLQMFGFMRIQSTFNIRKSADMTKTNCVLKVVNMGI
jgi:hypothetical protein